MAAREPEHRIVLPALGAAWLTMTFLHWPLDPVRVQALLPEGLVADEYDGAAWVSLTPFVMAGMRPGALPVPRAGGAGLGPPAGGYPAPSTPETNLRIYVRGPDGRDGLWFLSLDVRSALLAAAMRGGVGAPYHPARMEVVREGRSVRYRGERSTGRGSYRVAVRPGDPIEPGGLETWLTSRWRAYTRHLGSLLVTPVSHEPWPLRSVEVDTVEEDLTDQAGLPGLGPPALAHFSDGVRRVRIGPPRPVLARCAGRGRG